MRSDRVGTRMTVGELSRLTGVRVKTLREYTDLALIHTLGRSPANYRLYDGDALWCVRFIGELRGLGLTVAEIREPAARADGAEQPVGSHLAELLDRSRERLRLGVPRLRERRRRAADPGADREVRGRTPG